MDVISDLLITATELQNLNSKELSEKLKTLSEHEKSLLTGQVMKLAKLLNLNTHIYIGKRVANGVIAGTKNRDGVVYSALIDGPDIHEWHKCEDITF